MKMPSSPGVPSPRRLTPGRIALIYAVLGGGWITISDRIVQMLNSSPEMITRIQSYKGWFFVGLTAVILSFLVRRYGEESRESEERFRAIFESARDGMLVADVAGKRFVMGNGTIARMLGYAPAEIPGLGVKDIHPPADLPHVLGQFDKQVRGDFSVAPDTPVLRKDGTIFYADINSTPVQLNGKKYLLGIFRDVSERKGAEDAVRRSESILAQAGKIANLGAWMIDISDQDDLNANPLRWSDETYRIFGYQPGEVEVTNRLFLERVHPEDRERIMDSVTKAMAEKKSYCLEHRVLRPDGAEITVIEHAEPTIDDQGRITGMVGTVKDITAAKRGAAELAVRTRHNLLAAEIGGILVRNEDLRGLLQLCSQALVKHLDAAFARIWTLSRKDNVLELQASAGMYTHLDGDHSRLAVGEYKIGLIAQERKPHLTNEVSGDPRISDPEWARREGMVAFAGYPLIVEDRLVGVMAMFSRQPFEAVSLAALESIADEIALGIERKQAEERICRQLQKLSALRAIDMMISSSLDLRVILKILIEQVVNHLGVDAANVLLLDSQTMMLEHGASQGFRTGAPRHVRLHLGQGYAGIAALENRIIRIPDLKKEGERLTYPSLFAGEDFVSYYGVPLVAKGQVKGVLEIFHRSPLRPDDEWLEFLEGMALQASIAIDNNSLFLDLQQSNLDLTMAYDSTIEGWSRALDYRDKETEGHSRRVTEMTLEIARSMGIGADELVHVRRGALLHDIGKMGIPDSILLKPGPLTDEEWAIMRRHPVYALELLSPIAYLRPALDIPYCHHEMWDGSGYPRGLKGEEIPLAARIFAMVDVWDALASDRPYRPAWPREKIIGHMRSLAGSQFDPRVSEAFLNLVTSAGKNLEN
ncbi:MAG: PAS domain S-box protein [Desulfobacteraceae bacterium]|nr:PAS domain S-box protein [Desulfobacteraceae bacterium]